MIMNKRKWSFHCGSQYVDWRMNNCELCKHFNPDSEIGSGEGCEIEEQIALAYIAGDEIEVPDELIETGNYYPYECTKKEMIEHG